VTRIQRFCKRSGVGIWKCDSGHLWCRRLQRGLCSSVACSAL